jgi:hypothetical protein
MSYQFSNTTSLSDETYLEAFVESISASFPNEMRRNLEHLRDLDNSSCQLMEEWRDKQDACLHGVVESLIKAFGVEVGDKNSSAVESGVNVNSLGSVTPARTVEGDAVIVVASDEKKGAKRKQPQQQDQRSTEKKVACTQCRARKVKCDGRQTFCLNRRSLQSPDEGGESVKLDKSPEVQTEKQQQTSSQGSDLLMGKKSLSPRQQPRPVMMMIKRNPPTSDEIEAALATHYPNCTFQRQEISSMYREMQQLSDEKIKTARQLKAMIDMTLGRLNRDFEKFEKELGIDPTTILESSANTIGVSLLGGVPGVGLGMVNHQALAAGGLMMMVGTHHGANGINNPAMVSSLASAGATSAVPKNATNLGRTSVSATPSELLPPHASSLQQSYNSTRGGILPPAKSVQTNLAAIKVTPNSPDWILAKIISHDKSARMYTLSDEDVHSNQIYKISEKQVVSLKGTERNKWARGDVVYAVYPDTTSFYHATVSTPPLNGYVMVQFKDDWDANGVTHEKAVLVAHVMKVPPGGK